ncbi:MAG: peptidase [Bacteroidales bacterium]|nr:MAG: peptidase [Bacteroidales bacterium]
MRFLSRSALVVIILTISINCISQSTDIFTPINIQKAFAKRTRSNDGKPGIVYWQNRADYRIDVALDPKTLLISGKETITYTNNSPDTLKHLIFHLFPNMYKKGNMRDSDIDPTDESDGVAIDKFAVNDHEMDAKQMADQLYTEHTLLKLSLKSFLLPDKQVSITIHWHYTLNRNSHIRTGLVDSTSFFVAYFFPRIAVYDDIDGWNYYKYTNEQEFYNDFGLFDVTISMPKGYLVWATGTLTNPNEVLSEKYSNRFKAVSQSNVIMHIVDTTDLQKGGITKSNDFNKWHFMAENVNDFAFGTSNHYLWDAVSIIADKQTGRKVLLDVAYNKDSKEFSNVISIGRKSIDLMTNSFPAFPFPFPKFTIFNGLSEMEYPMMANNRSIEDVHSLIDLTAHELFHSYFPFYCGFNEVKYAWMDEGLTSLATYYFVKELDANYERVCFVEEYQPDMGTTLDLPIFTNSSVLRRPVYDYLSYPKAALFFLFLKDVLGDEVFNKSIQEFITRWSGKHPLPYDLLNTISNVSGRDINWFIKPWVFEFGYVDMGVEIAERNEKYFIKIERLGNYPAPINLKVFYEDGVTEIVHHSAEVWKNRETSFTIEKFIYKKIIKVELLDEHGIDVNPSNNSFTANRWRSNNR